MEASRQNLGNDVRCVNAQQLASFRKLPIWGAFGHVYAHLYGEQHLHTVANPGIVSVLSRSTIRQYRPLDDMVPARREQRQGKIVNIEGSIYAFGYSFPIAECRIENIPASEH